jgi:hypothetical protein
MHQEETCYGYKNAPTISSEHQIYSWFENSLKINTKTWKGEKEKPEIL